MHSDAMFRPGTQDYSVHNEVVALNCYRIPKYLPEDANVIDVGANIGCFSYVCARRDAKAIIACEPDGDNFRVLQHNLAPYPAVQFMKTAVWGTPAPERMQVSSPQDAGDGVRRTGGVRAEATARVDGVRCMSLDNIIQFAFDPGARVHLLKIDCEGGEWPILFGSEHLDRVDNICGEYHLRDRESFAFDGIEDHSVPALRNRLSALEFPFIEVQSPNHGGVGLFWASREPFFIELGAEADA